MSLQYLLDLQDSHDVTKDDVSEERLLACLPQLKKQIAFYRAYPDIFIDDLSGYSEWNRLSVEEQLRSPWKGFQFYYFQRLTIRILMRHRKTYIVFSRGSKGLRPQ